VKLFVIALFIVLRIAMKKLRKFGSAAGAYGSFLLLVTLLEDQPQRYKNGFTDRGNVKFTTLDLSI